MAVKENGGCWNKCWLKRENPPSDIDLAENPVAFCNVQLEGKISGKKNRGCGETPKLRANCSWTAAPISQPVAPQRGARHSKGLHRPCVRRLPSDAVAAMPLSSTREITERRKCAKRNTANVKRIQVKASPLTAWLRLLKSDSNPIIIFKVKGVAWDSTWFWGTADWPLTLSQEVWKSMPNFFSSHFNVE